MGALQFKILVKDTSEHALNLIQCPFETLVSGLD